MKKLLKTAIVALALLAAFPASAELQCWESKNGPPVRVQNANQCASYGSNAYLLDTSTNKWTRAVSGEEALTPFAPTSQADCGENETFYPNSGEMGGSGGTCQPNGRNVTDSITAQQQAQRDEEISAQRRQQQLQQQTQQQTGIGGTGTGGLNCSGPNGECTYTPLEPLPTGDSNAQSGRNFPAFVSGMFRVLITLGGLFSVVMFTVAGIGYMISESAIDVDKAKKRARAAFWGLLLLAASWLILNTINPDLVTFRLLVGSGANTGTNTSSSQNTNSLQSPQTRDAFTQTCEGQNKKAFWTPEGGQCF